MSEATEEFVNLVLKNLEKNGFPAQKVSFPFEKMYEEADRRGFSFNRVRDILRKQGIESELTDTKVVFRSTLNSKQEETPSEQSRMYQAAQEMFSKMSPEEQQRIFEMMSKLTPAQMDAMKQQWENLSAEEKAKIVP